MPGVAPGSGRGSYPGTQLHQRPHVPRPAPQGTTQAPGQTPATGPPPPPAQTTVSPQDSTYFDTLAKAEFAEHQRINSLNQQLGSYQANSTYQLGQAEKQLPVNLYNNRAQANKQGLLESGILGQRQGNIATQYAAKRAQMVSQEQQREQTIAEQIQGAKDSYNQQVANAALAAQGRAVTTDEKTGPNDNAPSSQSTPATAQAAAARTGTGPRPTEAVPGAPRGSGRAPLQAARHQAVRQHQARRGGR